MSKDSDKIPVLTLPCLLFTCAAAHSENCVLLQIRSGRPFFGSAISS